MKKKAGRKRGGIGQAQWVGVVDVMKGRDCSKRGGGLHIYIIQKGKGNLAVAR